MACRLASAGTRLVSERFSVDKMVEGYVGLYRNLIPTPPQASRVESTHGAT
jgi:hypothetical protein